MKTSISNYTDFGSDYIGYNTFVCCCIGLVDVKKKLRVAVIGAGASGLCAVRHCSKFSDCISVTLYEQGAEIGGKWTVPTAHNGLFPNNADRQFR